MNGQMFIVSTIWVDATADRPQNAIVDVKTKQNHCNRCLNEINIFHGAFQKPS